MKRISVNIREYRYFINISDRLLEDPVYLLPLKVNNRVMLITNETLAPIYLDSVVNLFEKIDIKVDNVIIPDGEQHKNLVVLNSIFTALLQKQHGRDTTLLALGGGVLGDLTGFAAASYQRGVRFIQIPTTLLSQVDSSIGGKTAINHPLGKNMIGAFYHPASVIININFLKTLPVRELASGLAEVIKYGIAVDGKLFLWLEKNIDFLLKLDNQTLMYCVFYCCRLKAKIVAIDERELGLRALLNLGHTFGHAIETEMGYGNWLHGEAVAVGIVIAARISERLGYLTAKEIQHIIALLVRAGLPIRGPIEMTPERYLPYIVRDKKVLANEIRLVIPLKIGKSKIFEGLPYGIILDAINDCQYS